MALAKRYNPKESEPRWQKHWQEEGIYRFNPDSGRQVYSIDTPPPTVSGMIHMGHIFSYVQAEVMARYHRMTGKEVFYPFCFDDNGLPSERFTEKVKNVKATDMTRASSLSSASRLQRTPKLSSGISGTASVSAATGPSCTPPSTRGCRGSARDHSLILWRRKGSTGRTHPRSGVPNVRPQLPRRKPRTKSSPATSTTFSSNWPTAAAPFPSPPQTRADTRLCGCFREPLRRKVETSCGQESTGSPLRQGGGNTGRREGRR